jgi:hypothetical protein
VIRRESRFCGEHRVMTKSSDKSTTRAAHQHAEPHMRWQASSSQFTRLAGIVEAGRVRLGAIAVSQEAAATQIEAAEHALGRLVGDVAGLLPKQRG